jgi:hypothetical protein
VYGPLVDILDRLRATAAMTVIDASRVAAKLVAGKVPDGQLKKVKDKLAACSVPIVMFVPRGPIGKIICRARLLGTIEHIKTMQMAIFVGLPTCLRCLSGLLP